MLKWPWWMWRPRHVSPPERTIVTAKPATLLTVTRDGDTIVLRDQGVEVRRMRKWQALNLIARLAMAVRDTDGA